MIQSGLLCHTEAFYFAPSGGGDGVITPHVAPWIATWSCTELPRRRAELIHKSEECLHRSVSIRNDETVLVPE